MSWFASLFSLQKVETQFTLKHINQGVEGCKVGWLGWCRRSDRAPEDKQANIQTKQKKSNKHTNKKTRVAGGMTRLQQTVQLWLAQALAPAAGSVKSIYIYQPPGHQLSAFPRFWGAALCQQAARAAVNSEHSLDRPWRCIFFFSLKNAKWGQTKQHDVQQITRSSSFIFRNLVALFLLQFVIQIWNWDWLVLIWLVLPGMVGSLLPCWKLGLSSIAKKVFCWIYRYLMLISNQH